jgi:ribosomal protein S18 acetylase RimI-like enzyme
MTTFAIRAARPEEFDAVGELIVRAYVEGGHLPSTDSRYAVELNNVADRARSAELLVAVEGGKVVGSVTIARYGGVYAELARRDELEFRMLAVAPEAAGRGVGRSLVQAVLDRAEADGCAHVVLCSLESMTIAHRLYLRLGFRRLPDRDWEPLPGVPLLVFSRETAHTP